ncbi:MAG TPA: response regulator [Planctomycetota bacterium]|nr:response regulator [Planctomycetota bacterium]
MRILVIEDDFDTLETLMIALTFGGHEPIGVTTRDDALRVLSEPNLGCVLSEPNLGCVLSDWNMPGLAAEPFLEHLRQHRPELPVILISASEESERYAAENGLRHLPKPFDMSRLLAFIG